MGSLTKTLTAKGRQVWLRPADRPRPRPAGDGGKAWAPRRRGDGGGGVRAAEGAGRACDRTGGEAERDEIHAQRTPKKERGEHRHECLGQLPGDRC